MARARHDPRLALAAIVALALCLRLVGVGDRLSADEGYSWLVGSSVDLHAFLTRLAAFENTPPLFYVLLAPLPPGDEAWLRLPALVAGVATVPVLYLAVRALLGTRPALLAALLLAVAPFHVSFSNYSRAFTLATLGLVIALWAAARLATGARERWWLLYAGGGALALYSEYYALLCLAGLAVALAVAGPAARRRRSALLGLAPIVVLLPWAGQIARSLDAIDVTKASPVYPGPSPASVRDVAVPLAAGEHGTAAGAGLRTLQLLLVAAALGLAARWLWRRSRVAACLFAGTAVVTLLLHALTALAGPDVFAQRYLLFLVPLGAAVGAAGVAALPWRGAVPLAVVACLGIAAAIAVTRGGRELEPSVTPVRTAVLRERPDVVLTNSATVAYYLRDLSPAIDRPFGLDPPSIVACAKARCRLAFVDDERVAAPRPGSRLARSGPFVVGLPAGRSTAPTD